MYYLPFIFKNTMEKFADIQILNYEVPKFEELTLKQKELVYYLSEAALHGRDILFDQNCKHNLSIRRMLEAIYQNYKGDRTNEEFANLVIYLKRIWFSSGIHHHYGCEKFEPNFSESYLKSVINSIPLNLLPLDGYKSVKEWCDKIFPVIFNSEILYKRVNQAEGEDLIQTSACNYYSEDLTQEEVESFYEKMKDKDDNSPISYGLNSRLIKENGIIKEQIWKIGGMYSPAIEKIVYWLEKASIVAENDKQKAVIDKLISFYKSGSLKEYDEYSILWVEDLYSDIDFVNGFTETYGDPLGMKASWESLVNFKNKEATKRTEIISNNAQWFEDNSPTDKQYKKENVKGVSAKVITAAILAGDLYPATAIGINLPNSNWIRAEHGSKSVTIENITDAYHRASKGNGFYDEFVIDEETRELLNNYGEITSNIHTDLHECLGHGSGRLLEGIDPDALKAYGATIEEARADLFGLYYMADQKLVELGLLPNMEAYKAEYYSFLMNGLMTQITRIDLGKDIEESHMRNRQLISKWVYEKGRTEGAVEIVKRNNKSFVKVNDYEKLRLLFGELLREIQRIKSTGDIESAKNLVEKYAVKIDLDLHKEILERYKALNLSPYKGFVNPKYEAVRDESGNIIDIKIEYDEDYTTQMIRYSRDYSNLPSINN